MITDGLATTQMANFDPELTMVRERAVSPEDVVFAPHVSAEDGDEPMFWPNGEGQIESPMGNRDPELVYSDWINVSGDSEMGQDEDSDL